MSKIKAYIQKFFSQWKKMMKASNFDAWMPQRFGYFLKKIQRCSY